MQDYNIIWVHCGTKHIEVRQDKEFVCLVNVFEINKDGSESFIHSFNDADKAIAFAKGMIKERYNDYA